MNAILKKGFGYWDITRYPYGGDFRRAVENTPVEIIPGKVGRYPARETEIEFSDGSRGVVQKRGLIEGGK